MLIMSTIISKKHGKVIDKNAEIYQFVDIGSALGSSSAQLNVDSVSSVQSLSRVRLFETPWITGHQASLSITNSQSPPKPMCIESVMPSHHLILCRPLLLLSSIFPIIKVLSSESALCIRWPKYWSFSFSPSNEYSGLISFSIDQFDLLLV